MGQIKIKRGTVSEGDAQLYHLVSNHLLDPTQGIDKVIMYAEQRNLMTLLTSGARDSRYTAPGYTPKEKKTVATKIKQIPSGELIKGNAWKYRIMGRIQKASEIAGSAVVGTVVAATTTRGGTFKLKMRDNYLVPGMNVTFANGKQARVIGLPTGSVNQYLYTFETYPGETFNWDTWVAIQTGRKTCFGGYTTYGEKSRRGYGRFHYPETYINHASIQRKSISLSGDVDVNDVIWYEYNGAKGFVYEAERQARAQLMLEDEHSKWWGKSTMKDQYGNLLDVPSKIDHETGMPLYQGDGWYEQIKGANDVTASGTDGLATYEDFSDLARSIRKKRNMIGGHEIVVVTGSKGMSNANEVIANRLSSATPIIQNINLKDGDVGGDEPSVGYRFRKLNIDSDTLFFVEHPMMDDEERFPRRLSNGELAMSATYYALDFGEMDGGMKNIEIRAVGNRQINRNLVYHWEKGIAEKDSTSPVDANAFHMLKHDAICVRNANTNGKIEPAATA